MVTFEALSSIDMFAIRLDGLIMAFYNRIMVIHNWIMDLHKWIIDLHKSNYMELHKSNY